MQNILGISLGTRLLGVAVLYDGNLCDFRVRTFYGAWTHEKRKTMHETISKTAARYGITAIVMKTPKASHCSQSIQDLITDIRKLSEQTGIKVSLCTVSDLTAKYKSNTRCNKQVLVQAIIAKYPQHRQLAECSAKDKKNSAAYHIRMFEAIACAEQGLETGK